MDQPEKLNLQSLDIKQQQAEKLKELFPEVFTEGNKIDWDKLRLTLGEQVDVGKERFGMNWPGKADCFKTIQQPSVATLAPSREESVDFDTTQNLFIEGDNLEVLKLLQKSYLGKVKMIYIDPPYNTGNEFIYPDNYSENLQTYLEYTGQVDSEGRKFSTNAETDGRFHSKWMNMMYPRLFLAKNLLKDNGSIFISIDDAEVNNLQSICNEIFGEENFIARIVWQRTFASKNDAKYFSQEHEYVLVYSKNISSFKLNLLSRSEKQNSRYANPDNDDRGPWTSTDLLRMEHRENSVYKITSPVTGKDWAPHPGTSWRHPEKEMLQLIANNEVTFGSDGNAKPRRKRFLKDVKQGIVAQTIWKHDDVGHTQEAKQHLNRLFNNASYFDTPKPIRLLRRIIEISTSSSDNDIVLDFFSGSSSMAHAVYEANVDDSGNRNFICVQLPEPLANDSEAFKDKYVTIADIGKERIRKAIQKINSEDESDNDMFKVNLKGIDLGFKVFKLNQSNFTIWQTDVDKTPESIAKQLELNISHVSPEATQEAILFELLLKSGFELTTSIHKEALSSKTVYSVAEGELLVCLEKKLTLELIKSIAEKRPSRVICLDEGFQNNDQLKTNAVQIMKSKGVLKFQTV